MRNENPSPRPRRIAGLDSLRFIAALWVALGHGARPPLNKLIQGPWAFPLQRMDNAIFNGVAAVVVFFVISGLVIHWPQAETNRVKIFPYLTRRLLRILPPLYISILLGARLGLRLEALHIFIYWSIACEILYYLFYPALLAGFRRFGIGPVLAVASALAALLIIRHWSTLYWGQLDIAAAAIIGLPCWLLGCLLAARLRKMPPGPAKGVWGWRFCALALSMALKIPVTHGAFTIGYPASHWVFAIFAFFWLQREIAWRHDHPPLRLLEWAGQWSYSIYLIHGYVLVAFARPDWAHPLAMWALQLLAILAASYVFYLAVERPAHLAARYMGTIAAMRRKESVAA